jgi:hypothetical protein
VRLDATSPRSQGVVAAVNLIGIEVTDDQTTAPL